MDPHGHACVVCGRPITVLEHYAFRGTCEDWKCRATLFGKLREERRLAAEQHDQHRRRLEAIRDERLQALGFAAPVACPALELPANRRPLLALPEERRQSFAEHLQDVVAVAFAGQAPDDAAALPATDSPPEEPYQGEPADVLAAACATCAGHCCLHGGENAYLTAATIRAYRARHPEAAATAVCEAYLSRVADTVYEHSCVFHGGEGCRLPRDMRSDACNSFYCEGLTRVQDACTKGPARLFLAAMAGEAAVRWRVVEVYQGLPGASAAT